MKDFDIKGIEKYLRQKKKNTKKAGKTKEDRIIITEKALLNKNSEQGESVPEADILTQEREANAFLYFISHRIIKKIFTPKRAAVGILLILFLVPVYIFCSTGSFSYLSDEGEQERTQKAVWTTASTPREIASTVTVLDKADRVDVENFGSTYILTVVRAYPVSITVDGSTLSVNALDLTVAELLAEEGISLNEEDIISFEPSHIVREDEEIVIKRVTYRKRAPDERAIPYGRDEKQSPLLRRDSEVILREGTDGLAEYYYLDRYIDGVFDSEELMKTVILEPAVNEFILTGNPLAPASTVDKSKYTDIEIVDGKPEEFIDVIEDAVCTAYNYGPNAFGASGMKLIQGFVATDPDKIPYGTLLYIASDRFTYGWAVAADCGTAMMAGYVDIDCYFETYDESCIFGKKLLNVYIVAQLTQEQLEEYAVSGMFYSRVPKTLD